MLNPLLITDHKRPGVAAAFAADTYAETLHVGSTFKF